MEKYKQTEDRQTEGKTETVGKIEMETGDTGKDRVKDRDTETEAKIETEREGKTETKGKTETETEGKIERD